MTLFTITLALMHLLTDRAMRIYLKQKDTDPSIGGYERTLVPAAEAFNAAFKAVQMQRTTKNRALQHGRVSAARLADVVRSWLGMVARDLPDFELDVVLDAESPDKVLGYAENLVAVIEERKDELPYAPALLEHVGGTAAQARADWQAAQDELGELQVLRRTLRDRAVAMNRELIAFRRTLRSVLGTSHRDYQALRVRRAAADSDELEVEPVEPVQPEAQQNAPANGATPPRA